MNNEILNLIQSSDAIPSVPQIVTRFLEITSDEDHSAQDVVAVLSSDPGVAGDVLRLANSPLLGVTRKVASLLQATNLLGIRRIRTLVMARCMVEKLNSTDSHSVDISYYWRRSLATGVLAARFADQLVPALREEAFVSGLLSDVGIIILARAVPDKYAAVAKGYGPLKGADLLERERQAVGTTHPEVSALVIERWTLPETMVAAVQHHHDKVVPDDLPKGINLLTRCVHGASDIARLLCEVPDSAIISETCVEAMQTVGLSICVLQHVLSEIESDVAELASVLHIDVIPSRVYDIIANSIAEQLEASVS